MDNLLSDAAHDAADRDQAKGAADVVSFVQKRHGERTVLYCM